MNCVCVESESLAAKTITNMFVLHLTPEQSMTFDLGLFYFIYLFIQVYLDRVAHSVFTVLPWGPVVQ